MKKLYISVTTAFLTSLLVVAGTSLPVSNASADTVDFAASILLASTDYKGIHPSQSHLAFQRRASEQTVQLENNRNSGAVMLKGKPPYNRHTPMQHELEKAQLVEFNKKIDNPLHERHDIYRGAAGKYPPYKRSW